VKIVNRGKAVRLASGMAPVVAVVMMAVLLSGNVYEERDVRILLTTGGHDFQQDPFFEMFDKLPGVEYTHVKLPDSAHLLKPGLEEEYDVVVMYDMVESITEDERRSFIGLLQNGIGIVSLHHNLGAHRDWPEFTRIIGGKYIFTPRSIDGKKYAPSTFAHDQDIFVEVSDRNHAVVQGITDFQIHDETYQGYYTSPDVRVLLTTEHPKSDRALAWTNQYGESRVIYLLSGHDSLAWRHPTFPKLLLNAILWAANR
jgi:type 1 glutamine amidotransferase